MEQNFHTFGNLIKTHQSKSAAAEQSFPKTSRVIKNQILTARQEAEAIVRRAQKQAEKIQAETLAEAEIIKETAQRDATEKALLELETDLLEAREIRDHILRETEKDLLRLAIRLAEKIIGREIEKDEQTIVDMIATALQNARRQQKITVRVNPKDLPLVEKESARFASASQSRFIDFVADPRVATTGCLIESEVGSIDARLETQLKVLERALLSQSEGEINDE